MHLLPLASDKKMQQRVTWQRFRRSTHHTLCNCACSRTVMVLTFLLMLFYSHSSGNLMRRARTVSVELCQSAWSLAVWRCWWWLQLAFLQSVAVATGSHAWLWKYVLIPRPAQRSAISPQCRWRDMRIQLTSTLSRLAAPVHEQLVNCCLNIDIYCLQLYQSSTLSTDLFLFVISY